MLTDTQRYLASLNFTIITNDYDSIVNCKILKQKQLKKDNAEHIKQKRKQLLYKNKMMKRLV